jgi:serine/threonine protein kinase/tetratricopeptide (TPR) repeat protein
MSQESAFGAEPEQLRELLFFGLEDSGEETDSKASYDIFAEIVDGRIGRYSLLKMLGEGGMGIVYLAQQDQPIKREGALKVIKPGMDTKRVISRFETERQVLALLKHPNIAQVYDAGTTDSGRPYFVMEYVEGLPITEHCDHYKLTIEERLDLFLQVCQAVQHAHQKGIIHRDIKPSNILVSTQDGQTIPKIIDFGVAKAISQPLTDRTLYTEQDQLFGTPEYMSPEQVDMANEDIDIRSDIYSLGVLLYVLLTGVLPFDSKTLREGGVEHVRQVIRQTDPKTPSTRLSSMGDEARKMAESRKTEISSLVKCLHKELEWIPIKAMRKERAERYQSASELAEDVKSYLNGDALTAGPPSTVYRLKKLVRRNRALVTGIAAVLVVLIAGVVVSTIFAFRAERQARNSQAISDFLINDLLASVQEVGATKREVTIESLLDVALERLEGKFATEPLIEASIRGIIADTYFKIGNFEAAQSNMKRAIELRTKSVGADDFQTLWLMLAQSWYYMEDLKNHEAQLILEDTIDGMKRILSDDDWHLLEATSRLAWVYWRQGRLEDAEKLQAEALEVVRTKLGPEHRYAPNHMEGLAFVYWEQGDHERALNLAKKALEISRRDDWNRGEEANITKSLAWMYQELGRYSEAEDMYLNGLELKRRLDAGEENHFLLQRIGELGTMYRMWKKYDEAEQWLLKAEEIARRVFGNEHKITNSIVNNLIDLYKAWDKPEKADEWRAKLPKTEAVEE